jgi:hypothetical protein
MPHQYRGTVTRIQGGKGRGSGRVGYRFTVQADLATRPQGGWAGFISRLLVERFGEAYKSIAELVYPRGLSA